MAFSSSSLLLALLPVLLAQPNWVPQADGCGGPAAGQCVGCVTGNYRLRPGLGSGTGSWPDWNTPCTACESCSPGTVLTGCGGASAGECFACAHAKFKNVSGHWNASCTDCEPCPGGAVRTRCGADFEGDCTPCGTGLYKPSAGEWDSACTVCPSCEGGKYRTSCGGASAGECTDCESGKYRLVGGADRWHSQCKNCLPCAAGSQRVGCGLNSSGTCDVCAEGWCARREASEPAPASLRRRSRRPRFLPLAGTSRRRARGARCASPCRRAPAAPRGTARSRSTRARASRARPASTSRTRRRGTRPARRAQTAPPARTARAAAARAWATATHARKVFTRRRRTPARACRAARATRGRTTTATAWATSWRSSAHVRCAMIARASRACVDREREPRGVTASRGCRQASAASLRGVRPRVGRPVSIRRPPCGPVLVPLRRRLTGLLCFSSQGQHLQ